MANTIEMLRLMHHAADLLAGADPTPDYRQLIQESGYSKGPEIAQRLKTVVTAITYAEAILRLVAAAMDDEPPAVPSAQDTETADVQI